MGTMPSGGLRAFYGSFELPHLQLLDRLGLGCAMNEAHFLLCLPYRCYVIICTTLANAAMQIIINTFVSVKLACIYMHVAVGNFVPEISLDGQKSHFNSSLSL